MHVCHPLDGRPQQRDIWLVTASTSGPDIGLVGRCGCGCGEVCDAQHSEIHPQLRLPDRVHLCQPGIPLRVAAEEGQHCRIVVMLPRLRVKVVPRARSLRGETQHQATSGEPGPVGHVGTRLDHADDTAGWAEGATPKPCESAAKRGKCGGIRLLATCNCRYKTSASITEIER